MKVKQSIKSIWNYVSLTRQINARREEHDEKMKELKKEQEASIPENEKELKKDLERITNSATYFVEKLKETSKKIEEKKFGMYNLKKEWGEKDWKKYKVLCKETETARIAKVNVHINYKGKKYTTQEIPDIIGTTGAIFIGTGIILSDPILTTYFSTIGIGLELKTLKTLEKDKLNNYANHITKQVKKMNEAFLDMYKQ